MTLLSKLRKLSTNTKTHGIGFSIRWKLTILMLLLVALTSTLLTAQQIRAQQRMLSSELATQTRLLKENLTIRAESRIADLAVQVENALAGMNLSGASEIVNQVVRAQPDIRWGALVNKTARIFVHTAQPELNGTEFPEKPALTRGLIIKEIQDQHKNAIQVSTLISTGVTPWGRLFLVYSLEPLEAEIAAGEVRIRAQMRQETMRTIISSIVFIILFGLIVFWIASHMAKPLLQLTDRVRQLAAGNFSAIQAERSPRNDEIGLLWDDFLIMGKQLEHSYRQLEAYNTRLQSMVEERTAQLHRKTAQVQQLLDNSGQGFLSFGPNLQINPEFSQECRNFFSEPIAGQGIHTLLFPQDMAKQNSLQKNFSLIFSIQDVMRKEILLQLLPVEYQIKRRCLAAEYRLLNEQDEPQFMLILSDITQEKALEAKINTEKEKFKFIVTAIKEADDVQSVLHELKAFLQEAPAMLADVAELYRKIHTYKGLFAQFEFPALPLALHQLESTLRKQTTQQLRISELSDFQALAPALEADLAMIHSVMGEHFFEQQSGIRLSKAQLALLETMAARLAQEPALAQDTDIQAALHVIRRLRQVDFSTLLENHAKAAVQLATRLDKILEPFVIEGPVILVDPDYFLPFTQALVHVFRNAVVHGLETPDERLDNDKPEAGHITCRVSTQDHCLYLEISDDGRGLNPEQLRHIAVQKGLLTREAAMQISDEDALRLIFAQHFSTTEQADAFSGRGVGLAAVQTELSLLGGQVHIHNRQGMGVTFLFSLPLPQDAKPLS